MAAAHSAPFFSQHCCTALLCCITPELQEEADCDTFVAIFLGGGGRQIFPCLLLPLYCRWQRSPLFANSMLTSPPGQTPTDTAPRYRTAPQPTRNLRAHFGTTCHFTPSHRPRRHPRVLQMYCCILSLQSPAKRTPAHRRRLAAARDRPPLRGQERATAAAARVGEGLFGAPPSPTRRAPAQSLSATGTPRAALAGTRSFSLGGCRGRSPCGSSASTRWGGGGAPGMIWIAHGGGGAL